MSVDKADIVGGMHRSEKRRKSPKRAVRNKKFGHTGGKSNKKVQKEPFGTGSLDMEQEKAGKGPKMNWQ